MYILEGYETPALCKNSGCGHKAGASFHLGIHAAQVHWVEQYFTARGPASTPSPEYLYLKTTYHCVFAYSRFICTTNLLFSSGPLPSAVCRINPVSALYMLSSLVARNGFGALLSDLHGAKFVGVVY